MASCVVLVPSAAVGAVGVPVIDGEGIDNVLGRVEEMEGIPELSVISMPLLAVARLPRSPALSYSKPLLVPPVIGVVPIDSPPRTEVNGTGPGTPPATVAQAVLAAKVPVQEAFAAIGNSSSARAKNIRFIDSSSPVGS